MKGIIKNKKRAKIIIYVIIIMTVEWLCLKNYYTGNPSLPPTMNIYYKEDKIKLEHGDFNWFEKSEGGNSHIYGDPVKTLEGYNPVEVSIGDFFIYNYSSKPRVISVRIFKLNGNEWNLSQDYILFYSNKKYERTIAVPQEKGEYIFDISGNWDETHTTCHVFKIKIN